MFKGAFRRFSVCCSAGVSPLSTALLLFLLTLSSAHALTIPAGGRIDVGGGAMELGCENLTVAGTLTLGTGSVAAGAVTIESTGIVTLGSGNLTIRGALRNLGILDTQQGRIAYGAGCGGGAPIPSSSPWSSLAQVVILLLFTFLFLRRGIAHGRV